MVKGTIGLLAACLMLLGCVVVRLPDELMDDVSVELHDIQLGSVCTYSGRVYSPGSRRCMDGREMECEAGGHWVERDGC